MSSPPVLFSLAVDEAGLVQLAEIAAFQAVRGDCIALRGELGAGKTTFARAFICAASGDAMLEVPSPTFALRQDYACSRGPIAHFDLYRLADAREVDEIGLEDALAAGVTIIEWPERAEDALPRDRIELVLAETASPETRQVTLSGLGAARVRAQRIGEIFHFLEAEKDWRAARVAFLDGDASTRSYARLTTVAGTAILMDAPRRPDGPIVRDGLPYSQIAHLAEDVRPFVAISNHLVRHGFAATRVLARDLVRGLLIVEDFGDRAFGVELKQGAPQAPIWAAAVDCLAALRCVPVDAALPVGDGTTYSLPRFDRRALEIEVELLLDWFWPHAKGGTAPEAVRAEFQALWAHEFDVMLAEPPGLFLRDYHSPNLFWMLERAGVQRVGLIDFQDALAEPWAYDLVSVLQDARVDVPAGLEAAELARYCAAVAQEEPDFNAGQFRATYARFGVQRNTRLIGLWVRLLKRDGKPGYMQHMSRTWDYLSRNLEHLELAALRRFYDQHFPLDVRNRPISG